MNQYTRLDKLGIGQKAKIISLNQKQAKIKNKLLEMGMTKDTIVTIKKIAPFNDPIVIELRDYELCLRKEVLQYILVQVIS